MSKHDYEIAYIGLASSQSCKHRWKLLHDDDLTLYRELRLELGVGKNAFLDLTYPALFPSPPNSLLSHGEPSWYYYLAEIALRRLGNRILNFVYQHDHVQTSTANIIDAAHNFEEQARIW